MSAQDYSSKRPTQEARGAVSLQLSSSDATPLLSGSPLQTVTVVPSTETSCHGHSPPVATFCCSSHSPVYGGHSSSSSARSRSVRSTSEAFSRGKGAGRLYERTSKQSRRSHSPSRTSYRGGSTSPSGGKHGSHSRSSSQSRWADENHQEEQFSLDFVTVVFHLHSLTEFPEAPSEGRKIRGLNAALKDDDQPAASYKLPILADIDNRVCDTSSRMRSRKVSKLLQFQGVLSSDFIDSKEGA